MASLPPHNQHAAQPIGQHAARFAAIVTAQPTGQHAARFAAIVTAQPTGQHAARFAAIVTAQPTGQHAPQPAALLATIVTAQPTGQNAPQPAARYAAIVTAQPTFQHAAPFAAQLAAQPAVDNSITVVHFHCYLEIDEFRKKVYDKALWIRGFRGERSRQLVWRERDKLIDRVVPWLNRELYSLCGHDDAFVSRLMARVLEALINLDVWDKRIEKMVYDMIGRHTRHFVHELLSFVTSDLDIQNYDNLAIYPEEEKAVRTFRVSRRRSPPVETPRQPCPTDIPCHCRRHRRSHPFRKLVYEQGLYMKGMKGSNLFKNTIAKYRSKQDLLNKLVPWMNRELYSMFGDDNYDFVQEAMTSIISLLLKMDIRSPQFGEGLFKVIGHHSLLFIHELISYASRDLDMKSYDSKALYAPAKPLGSY